MEQNIINEKIALSQMHALGQVAA